ncbi:MAG: non-canonical purine NTP pyrophosphatase [Gallintestinimicrobium sp.]
MKEIREILNGTGWNVLSLKDAGIDAEIEENGTTFEENAKIKAEASETGVWKTGFRAAAGFRRKKLLCWRMIPDWKSTGWAESRAFILHAIWA